MEEEEGDVITINGFPFFVNSALKKVEKKKSEGKKNLIENDFRRFISYLRLFRTKPQR